VELAPLLQQTKINLSFHYPGVKVLFYVRIPSGSHLDVLLTASVNPVSARVELLGLEARMKQSWQSGQALEACQCAGSGVEGRLGENAEAVCLVFRPRSGFRYW
jgi:hypothetical protein